MFGLDNIKPSSVSIANGLDLDRRRGQVAQGDGATSQAADSPEKTENKSESARRELTADQQRQVAELQQIDRRVRAHEQAHLSAGQGLITSGPNYAYTYGPDGKQYATAGEVGIDTSGEKEPEANIDKGARIQVAALAPRDPSPQDYRVAAAGRQLAEQGRAELAQARRDDQSAEGKAGPEGREAAARGRVEIAYGTAPTGASNRISAYA